MRYRFGRLELDTGAFELRSAGRKVEVEPQVFDVLAYLLAHRGRVVSKEELLTAVWRGRFVSESALTTRIKQARQAVGDNGRAQRLIKTVHGRGYRFVADVRAADESSAPDPESAPDGEVYAIPPTRYVVNDGASIAYQCFGDGPNLVLVLGFATNIEVQWEHPAIARFLRGLAGFCRVALLDKRGTGLSDRLGRDEAPPLDQRADDVRAVMDAVGMDRATIFGSSEGGAVGAAGRGAPGAGRAARPARNVGPPSVGRPTRPSRVRGGGAALGQRPDLCVARVVDGGHGGRPPFSGPAGTPGCDARDRAAAGRADERDRRDAPSAGNSRPRAGGAPQ
ncbi:alpha/beta fold hydrolase [Actinoplanes sp. NPDC051633]|uniref:alpha/beta fold hydrolase n=1 Tax=Actinoplanes sp. NPDC051633 TaxID=3155670 RepID=UPI00343DD06B